MAAEEGQVIGCHTVEQWTEHFNKAKESKKLAVVDFTASWCGPCRFIAPILADIAKKMPQVIFLKVDVDELKSVSEDFKVEAMPTFVFLKEGNEVHRVVGAKKEELLSCIATHAAAASTMTA
ncbi:PREDICTED: thioredoxin H-type 1-like [Ipomoea nil]|uniref:thioredoxin H-type 1-like n=1 Tax=Ipomoea nil TaxID=35883 RepID=UPI0009016847|nr:PREDICTED: thioredoxin H-type 1-like [Ipomoea nil]